MSELLEEAQAVADWSDELWLAFMKRDKKKVVLGAGLILAGAALAGGTTAWLLARKKYDAEYALRADQEIAEAKAFYNRMAKDEVLKSDGDDSLMAEAVDALEKYQGSTSDGGDEEQPEVHVDVEVNVFERAHVDDEWDQDKEEEYRATLNGEQPYIISEEEYMENAELPQVTLTFYEGDQVLSDEKDQPIPLVDEVVGEGNLERFGHGCGDARTVFIRNDKMNMIFEVVKSDGKYAEEVLGFKHSDYPMRHPNRTKFRVDDD